jgi:CBS domain containing-hemolysin-like protein
VDETSAELDAELPESTRSMLERVVELGRLSVSDLMTPGSSIVALPAEVSALEAARAFRDSGFSRIPLFGAHRDDIVGVLYAKDLFPRLVDAQEPGSVLPRKLARPPFFVPESKDAADLLIEFRARRVQMAIALDEYGGVAGLISLEDLLEQVVGPIDDEHDRPSSAEPIIALGNGRFEIDGLVDLEDLNERLGLHLPTDGDFSTVGGFAFNSLGRLPEPGDSFRSDGAEFIILEVAEHSIRRLRVDLDSQPVVDELRS